MVRWHSTLLYSPYTVPLLQYTSIKTLPFALKALSVQQNHLLSAEKLLQPLNLSLILSDHCAKLVIDLCYCYLSTRGNSSLEACATILGHRRWMCGPEQRLCTWCCNSWCSLSQLKASVSTGHYSCFSGKRHKHAWISLHVIQKRNSH